METKRCTRCGLTKSLSAFSKNQGWCKACMRRYYVSRPKKVPLDKAFDIEF